MLIKKKVLILLMICMLTSCNYKTWQKVAATSDKISIDSTTDMLIDKEYEAFLQPIKQKIDAEMNRVIGETLVDLKSYAPESPLSNFCADVFRQIASEFLNEKIDIGIVNLGGLRASIPTGKITVRQIFELMPFENELVILWLKGDKLEKLLQYFASIGGEGISGIQMTIKNGKAESILVDNQPLDPEKTYIIATSNYLAEGNDNMIQLAEYEKRIDTGLKIRDILISHIQAETQKGNKIQSKTDGRITIIQAF
ncbi:MAG: 5'-nucleotidase C-terminal domain-containing protein [Paludibacteraceae bacterium]|nr:5'-nucleotidase C-terminal domain-containing protein [Paludibacteraceae bacterium]